MDRNLSPAEEAGSHCQLKRDLKDVQRGNDGRSLPVRRFVSVIEGCALLG